MLYPFTFRPICRERVWGGRRLAELFNKNLPSGRPIGETWEISDRPGAVSEITNGPLAGRDLRWLMENHAEDLLGVAPPSNGRFPLLVKLIDAHEDLSIQVHPPAEVAAHLGGEPKAEAWHIIHAESDARIHVGLKEKATREKFEACLKSGNIAECVHSVRPRAGDALHLPSGRLHALGGGIVLIEVQQNSDTTYRVFDWNRMGLDGQPRELHIEQALTSIDFDDHVPALSPPGLIADTPGEFRMESRVLTPGESRACHGLVIIGIAKGAARLDDLPLAAGEFALVPACVREAVLHATTQTTLILAEPA
ncbi:MAG: mannose-6-phosphate isomerase [Verrucomicrobiales bacterium]|nr:mannose-6-phosphate isomerase [Verrucomicrobiales bacterium]|tara:strand:- start:58762 stop:59688 length:927 start_codon:yes stop_codon:yes gene_type:complete